MGGSVPVSMLICMCKDLTQDALISHNNELDRIIINFCHSKGDLSLWLDLCATNNGTTEKYDILFSVAKIFVEEISRAGAYRQIEKYT